MPIINNYKIFKDSFYNKKNLENRKSETTSLVRALNVNVLDSEDPSNASKERLGSKVGTKVSFKLKGRQGSGKGQNIIDYFSNEDFNRIFELLSEIDPN